jgi:hypothetical protein
MVMTRLWFGTRNHETWLPMYAGGDAKPVLGYSSKSSYLNGGGGVRNSASGQQSYQFTWMPNRLRSQLRPIADFADGVYDDQTGVNLIYFITPDMADTNCVPNNWGFPAQAALDAMPIIAGIRPTITPTAANAFGYPARSAVYTLAGTETPVKLYIPIPPGYCAWIGFHGSATGSTGIQVTPFTLTAASAPTVLTPLAVTTSTRVNASVDSGSGFTGLELQAVIAAGTLTMSNVIVQMLPSGQSPVPGSFISGQGHSGCQFDGKPISTGYQLTDTLERFGLIAKLLETGAWL